MDEVALLTVARAAGLHVAAAGQQVVVRGPRGAAALAEALLDRKADVLKALAICPDERPAVATRPPDVWSDEAAHELTAHYQRCVGWAWNAIPAAQRTPALVALWDALLAGFAPVEAARRQRDMLALRGALAVWEQQAAPLFDAYRAAWAAARLEAIA